MKLKELRVLKNKTQEEVATELNIPRTKYARYETSTSEPNFDILIKLADYFHTTIDYLVGHEVPYQLDKAMFNEEQLAVIDELKKLNKEQCYMLLAYIEGLKAGNNRRENILRTIKGE